MALDVGIGVQWNLSMLSKPGMIQAGAANKVENTRRVPCDVLKRDLFC